MSDNRLRLGSLPLPSIIPLRQTLVRRVLQVSAAVMLLWLCVFLGLNDRSLGRLITKAVGSQIKGQFILGYAHYDYWSSLASLIFNTPAKVSGGDFVMRDPNGELVMTATRIDATFNIGELVRGLLRTAVSLPFGRGSFIYIHIGEGHLKGGWAKIRPIELPRPPGVVVPPLGTPYTEVNIVATMTSKKPRPEDAPPSPSRFRVVLDDKGVELEDVTYEMAFPGWHTTVKKAAGRATLRYSSDPNETRPGLPAFVYEVSPLTAEEGILVIGTKEGSGEFEFPLKNISLRRFGARASHRENLAFRGQAEVAGATVEIDGSILDCYCDTGVKLQLSFEHGGGLAALIPGEIVGGQPRGVVSFFGPFSSTLPLHPKGGRAPCLKETQRSSPFPIESEDRAVSIDGLVADADALVATIPIHGVTSRFRLLQGELNLPRVAGNALGGQLFAEPLRISLVGDMPWSARLLLAGTDPAQVELVPEELRPYLRGHLRGGFRLSGHLKKTAHPERIAIERVDAVLDRFAQHDPLPREVRITGSFSYSPEQVGWRGLHLVGENLTMTTERGSVGLQKGELDVPAIGLSGRGAALGRLLSSLGFPGGAEEAIAHLQLGGRILRPEVRAGEIAVTGLDLYGRKLGEMSSGFSLHDGELTLAKLKATGPLGRLSGDGALRLFQNDIRRRPADPALTLSAHGEQLDLSLLGSRLPVQGLLDGSVELSGTLHRPQGAVSLTVPELGTLGTKLTGVSLQAELQPDLITLSGLQAALGSGVLSGSAVIRRDGEQLLDLLIKPHRLPLRELPGLRNLPIAIDGLLSGSVRVLGPTKPFQPRLDGKLAVEGVVLSSAGEPLRTRPGPDEETSELEVESQPLFELLGMVVRSLTLYNGDLTLTERPDGGTGIKGRLFKAFDVEGALFLDPRRLGGEIIVRFGCERGSPNASPAATAMKPELSAECDLRVAQLLPDLAKLGDVNITSSGVLTLRFGAGAYGLFAAERQSSGARCQGLADKASGMTLGLPVAATLRLSRALLDVSTISDDSEELRYRVWNTGETLLCTDLESIEVGRAVLASQRTFAGTTSSDGSGHSTSSGRFEMSGLLHPEDTRLRLLGDLQLDLLEHFLRSVFRHTHGQADLDIMVTGKRDDLRITGRADLHKARLVPHAIDTPIEVESGHLELAPGRAALSKLKATVDGATMTVDGWIEVQHYTPTVLGKMDFRFGGDISARLLQWQFAKNLAEARGSLGVQGLHVTGSLREPQVEGTLIAKDLYINVRRFHDFQFSRGTVQFTKSGSGGRIVIGCPGSERGACRDLTGIVDGDGRVLLNGRVEHNGLGGLLRPDWYHIFDSVRVQIHLDNVRHTSPGIYNVEVSTPSQGLSLYGNRDQLHLSGGLEVVSGRYMQDFDLTDRILSARRVEEEDVPFWEGDAFLSSIKLGLRVRSRGLFRVKNNFLDLRVSTTDFAISGPLERIALGGVIRVESGYFLMPGATKEFQVKGDSRIDFSPNARWPDTPWVDVRGATREFDQNDRQRNIEVALRGPVSELKFDCVSSEGMSTSECASYLFLGSSYDSIRGGQPNPTAGSGGGAVRAIDYGDPAARLLTSQLLTNQVTDPLREKLRLDTVRIQFGMSSLDLHLCKSYGLYLRMCGLAEWGILGNSAARYRGFGQLQVSDLTVGTLSLERIERGFSFLESTVNRFKLQAGFSLPLRY